MKELGQLNLEKREIQLGKYGKGRGSLHILRGLPRFAAEERIRIGYGHTDLTHDWEKNPVKVKSLVSYVLKGIYESKEGSEQLSQFA